VAARLVAQQAADDVDAVVVLRRHPAVGHGATGDVGHSPGDDAEGLATRVVIDGRDRLHRGSLGGARTVRRGR
jgi:hypothetical protein